MLELDKKNTLTVGGVEIPFVITYNRFFQKINICEISTFSRFGFIKEMLNNYCCVWRIYLARCPAFLDPSFAGSRLQGQHLAYFLGCSALVGVCEIQFHLTQNPCGTTEICQNVQKKEN